MGMHNGASTTLGLAAAGYRCPDSCNILVLRSSNDYDCLQGGKSGDDGSFNRIGQKESENVRVNMSPDKSFLFDHGFGEYTSWFLDGELVSQYGVETSSMRLQRKILNDDYNSIAKTVHVALLANTINPIGGEIWLRIRIDNVRRLYVIRRLANKRGNIKYECQLLSDKEPSPWNTVNCLLEESFP